jgi:hypothetical protein
MNTTILTNNRLLIKLTVLEKLKQEKNHRFVLILTGIYGNIFTDTTLLAGH